MGRAQRLAQRRKELRNKLITRGELQEILERYHRGNVEPVQARVEWLSAPLYRRAWALWKAWWKREAVWPPRRPRWAHLPSFLRRSDAAAAAGRRP